MEKTVADGRFPRCSGNNLHGNSGGRALTSFDRNSVVSFAVSREFRGSSVNVGMVGDVERGDARSGRVRLG